MREVQSVGQEIEARERAQATQSTSSQPPRRPPRGQPYTAASHLVSEPDLSCGGGGKGLGTTFELSPGRNVDLTNQKR